MASPIARCFPSLLGPTTDESSYVIGSFKRDSLSASNDITASLNDIKHQLLMQRSNLIIDKSSPTKKDSKNVFINGSKHLIDVKDGTADKPMLMTRRELTDPFGSDEEDEQLQTRNKSKSPPPKDLISPPAIDNVRFVECCASSSC